jgi:predicted metal-binding membrane protein
MPRAAAPGTALAAIVACAWLALLFWGASPYARYLGHGDASGAAPVEILSVALFLTGWTLMITAMMLPTANELLQAFGQVVRRRPDRLRLQLIVVAGFLLIWIAVGSAFQLADKGVHAAVEAIGWLQARPQLISASALIGAGAFEFTTLKHRCLTACRSPRGFIYRHWHGPRPEANALRIGMAYGTSCAGCCWALMALLFALGTASVVWMLAVGALMAAEKLTRVGARLARPVGAALVAAGVVVALT